MIKYYIFLLIVFILIAIVQVILKTLSVEYSGNIIKSLYDPLIYLSIFLLVVALALWFISASQIEFSVLIPASLITIVISSIIGLFIFSEEISLRKIIAYVFIVIGLITLTLPHSKSADSSRTVLDNKETINLKDV